MDELLAIVMGDAAPERDPVAARRLIDAALRGNTPATVAALFEEAIRYGIEIEADYFGGGRNDEEFIAGPARRFAARIVGDPAWTEEGGFGPDPLGAPVPTPTEGGSDDPTRYP